MDDFEKLGAFYLGRPYDIAAGRALEGVVLYDSRDLLTHAVCVGMTGSGKTGLCIALLEEAAIDGIPAIAIDVKGDLANLALTFEDIDAASFLPWMQTEEAARRGLSIDAMAAREAERWRKGLAEWGQEPARIRRLREAADVVIYTPGSSSGRPLRVLGSFAPPPAAAMEDREAVEERIQTLVQGLLGLVGVEADPVSSREAILMATLLRDAWTEGRTLDLAGWIRALQDPPIERVGVLDVEAFFPARDRFALALRLNNLLASPSFASWLDGDPLDIAALLHGPAGKPRISVLSIAHLSDAERMFFVSLLLGEVLAWTRAQPGTTSLRAILYMDELFGYLPPVANPPSKGPLLTLLKQARAFGVGVVLATQNPVDLDYKALSNAGTWLIGRLQTERDKARLLDGLESASQGRGGFDRAAADRALGSLSQRVFLLQNVHEDAPVVFESRWALSYLRGPLTRAELRRLGAGGEAPAQPVAARSPEPSHVAPSSAGAAVSEGAAAARERPVLPPGIVEAFLPLRQSIPKGATITYEPLLLGVASVGFREPKGTGRTEVVAARLARFPSGPLPLSWDDAERLEGDGGGPELEDAPRAGALWGPLPAEACDPRSHEAWRRALADSLYRTEALELLAAPELGAASRPGESERDFRVRLQHEAREARDQEVAALQKRYAPKLAALEERIRRAQQAVSRESEQAKQSKLQAAISFGTSLLGAFLGRKAASIGNLGRASSAARGVGRAMKESQDVARAEENVGALEKQLADLDAAFQEEARAIEGRLDATTARLETTTLRPRKGDIELRLVALAWRPACR